MNNYGLSFHHLGLAVLDFEPSQKLLKDMGYKIGLSIYDPVQKVNICMCESEFMPNIELISAAVHPSPIDNLLFKQKSVIYHIAYETDSIQESINRMKEDGHHILSVSKASPAILFNKKLIAFYYIKGIGLVELVQK